MMIKAEIFDVVTIDFEWLFWPYLCLLISLRHMGIYCFPKISCVEEILQHISFTHSSTHQCFSVRMFFFQVSYVPSTGAYIRFLLLNSLHPFQKQEAYSIWTLITEPDLRSTAPDPPHYQVIWKFPSGMSDNLLDTDDLPE